MTSHLIDDSGRTTILQTSYGYPKKVYILPDGNISLVQDHCDGNPVVEERDGRYRIEVRQYCTSYYGEWADSVAEAWETLANELIGGQSQHVSTNVAFHDVANIMDYHAELVCSDADQDDPKAAVSQMEFLVSALAARATG